MIQSKEANASAPAPASAQTGKYVLCFVAMAVGLVYGLQFIQQSSGPSNAELMNVPHPHRGAVGADGRMGYVHDVYYVKNHLRPLNLFPKRQVPICAKKYGESIEGRYGMAALAKIEVVTPKPTMKKVLCIVYTHSNRHGRLESIVETYAPRCDGFLASSNATDKTLGAVNILHEGPEAYDNMWQKIRSTLAYVHDHYLDEFDFFHIGGDNMFVIAENLKHAVSQTKQQGPIYMGGALTHSPRRRQRFCGGGSGYTLNRRALQLLIERKDLVQCWPNHRASDEDRIVADCLRAIVNCTHDVDEIHETRYHPLTPEFHVRYREGTASNWDPVGLDVFHGIHAPRKAGLESISSTTVSFHLVDKTGKDAKESPAAHDFEDEGLRRLHAIVHNLCEGKNKLTDRPVYRPPIRLKLAQ